MAALHLSPHRRPNKPHRAALLLESAITIRPMMTHEAGFDFDRVVDRHDTASVKWDRYSGQDVLPLWVADMDFPAPPDVLAALHIHVGHGVFGYTHAPDSLVRCILAALRRDYAWTVQADDLVWLPGLVTGLNVACRAVGQAGDGVVTATPIYPPFCSAPQFSERQLHTVPLLCQDGLWQWDFPALAQAGDERTRLLLLCHPHNPTGRVWQDAELQTIERIATERDWVVVSDEIHCGLVLDEQVQHRPFACLSEQAAQRSITLMAPSKTWNIPGLGCAFAVIPNPQLRRRFVRAMHGIVPHVNALGYTATEAAYRYGEPWRQALLAYLRGNAERVYAALAECPGVHVTRVQATYLAWLDARALPVPDVAAFFEQAGVGLSDGREFGAPGFVRLNFGCPRATLDQALARMVRAVQALPKPGL